MRKEGSKEVSHFAHRPLTPKSPRLEDGSPACPYRTVSGPHTPDGSDRLRDSDLRNIRKIIESELYHVLLRKLSVRPGVTITISNPHDREPRIQIDGLARPLLILSIAPHEENLWRDPFDGTVQERQVLFFISSIDIPQLARAKEEINRKLLAKSSTITIFLPAAEGEDYTFAIVDKLSSGQNAPASGDSLDQLDLIDVDYKKLFAMERKPELLFIKTSEKSPIEYITKQLQDNQSPLARKLLQLFAKRLLVDSTRNHKIAFDEDFLEARQFFRVCNTFPKKEHLIGYEEVQQIMTNGSIHALIKEPPLWSLYGQLLFQAIEALRNSIKGGEDEHRNLAQQWATECKEMQNSIANLEAESRNLEQQLDQQSKKYEKESKEKQETIRKLEASSRDLEQQLEKRRRESEEASKQQHASITELSANSRRLGLQLAEKLREYENESARRKQFEDELKARTGQLAKTNMAKEEIDGRLRAKEKEFDAEQGRRQKLEDAFEKLRKVPLSRLIFKYYEIEVD
ncbi:MAG: hypothetical protein WAQ99_17480 [Pyrinomonadaceae bacterium]